MSDADFSKVFFKENQQEMRDLMFGSLFCWFSSKYGDFFLQVTKKQRTQRVRADFRWMGTPTKVNAGGNSERGRAGEHHTANQSKKERKVWLLQMDLLTLRF